MLARGGDRVLAVGRDPDRLRQAVNPYGPDVTAFTADLTREDDRCRLGRQVQEHGRLDVLVLGSGIYERSDDPDAFQRQFAANVHGPYALLRTLLPSLVAAHGQVVVINSTQGLAASPGVGQFAATQHAMRAVADSLRDEVNQAGVRVSSIFLGRTATERQARIFEAEGRAYPAEALIQPEDVAELVASLLNLPRTAEVTNVTLRPMRKV